MDLIVTRRGGDATYNKSFCPPPPDVQQGAAQKFGRRGAAKTPGSGRGPQGRLMTTQGAPASPPPVAGGSRAAILLTGHVRTFDLTAPTLNEFLVQANPGYAFSLFCSTYREREAVSIRSRQGPTEQKSLDEDELYVPYTSFIPRDRFHAELHRPFDIKRGLPFFNPQRAKTLSKNQTKNSGYRNYLRRMRHSSMFELIKRGYEMIERQAEIYHVVVKFRFDLGLKALLVINRGWVERGLVVMPVRIADGGAGIQPRVLATRPCSTDGSGKKRPSWVQDHVGYASPGTFRKFAVNVQRYNLRHTSPQKAGVARTPEYTLAGSLKEQKVDLTCDPTIQYTVKRRYLERPGQRFKKKKNGKLALTPEAHALKQ